MKDTKSRAQTARAVIESKIHQAYTVTCDELLMRGYIDRETRLAIGGLLGDLLTAFGDKLPPVLNETAIDPYDLDFIAVKAGRRHSASDEADMQTIHDLACKQGAKCDMANTKGASDDDLLVAYGGELKALGNGRYGGYLVRFSSKDDPDLTGDFFTKDTDFGDATETDVYYNHGLNPKIKRRKFGKAALRKDDVGVWMEGELALREEYEQAIYAMVEQKKQGLSSGTAPHLVEREKVGKAYWIKAWPLGLDGSITPTPAEPRNGVMALKALIEQQQPGQAVSDDTQVLPDALRGELEKLRLFKEIYT